MRRDGKGVCEIARAIGRDKSTVSRELKRNSCERFYRAPTAQRRYSERRLACRRPAILDDESVLALVGDKFLNEQWSPEQIEGRLALEPGASREPARPSTAPYGRGASMRASAGGRRPRGCAIAGSAAGDRRSGAARSRSRTRYPSAPRPPTAAPSPGTGRETRSPAGPSARAC